MGGLADLGIDLPILVAQIVNFAVLFGLLYLVAYKPVMRLLDERSRRIKEGQEQAKSMEEEASRAREAVKKQMEMARREGQNRIDRAVRMGEEIKQKAQEDARKEADSLIARARTEIQQERDAAIEEVRKEFADLALMAAGKVIDRSLDKKEHRRLIDKVLKESTVLKKG